MISCFDVAEQVLSLLTEPTSHTIGVPNSCKAFIAYGPLRLVHSLSSCGRLLNARKLKNSIAVMNNACTNPEKAQQIEKAGARGIIVLNTQVRQSIASQGMIGGFLCRQ